MADEYVRMKKSTLTAIGDAIRSKEGSTELIPPLEMPARIEAISVGIPTEWITKLNLTSLNVFDKEEVEITLPNGTDLECLAAPIINSVEEAEGKVNTTVKHLTINVPTTINAANVIATSNYGPDYTLEHLTLNVDLSKAGRFFYFIRNCKALKIIDGTPIDFSAATYISGALTGIDSLEEIRFKGVLKLSLNLGEPKKLSKNSIVSAMTILSPDVTDKTLTLSQTAVDTAFETSPGAADGSTSAEWLALVAEHSNWTISLRS